MIYPDQIIDIFSKLGSEFLKVSKIQNIEVEQHTYGSDLLAHCITESHYHNPWFIPSFVRFALDAWADALQEEKIGKWIRNYTPGMNETDRPAEVGIIMAGNIPMVGLHDLLCVLASGNHAIIKLSSADDQLIPAVLELLCRIHPDFSNRFRIIEGPMKNFDAIIATGSNNTSRYFNYYFDKYPHIIRKNRNSAAVITGNETGDELRKLADDILMYFGLGCRNVSKLYLPEGYNIEEMFPFFENYSFLSDMHKYRNNYEYQKSILLINGINHKDNGFLLAKHDPSLISPISVVHTESYTSPELLNGHLKQIWDQVQCIVSCSEEIDFAIKPGRSQWPELWDYSDGVDTMEFLMNFRKIH